jgi:hypothetical protein
MDAFDDLEVVRKQSFNHVFRGYKRIAERICDYIINTKFVHLYIEKPYEKPYDSNKVISDRILPKVKDPGIEAKFAVLQDTQIAKDMQTPYRLAKDMQTPYQRRHRRTVEPMAFEMPSGEGIDKNTLFDGVLALYNPKGVPIQEISKLVQSAKNKPSSKGTFGKVYYMGNGSALKSMDLCEYENVVEVATYVHLVKRGCAHVLPPMYIALYQGKLFMALPVLTPLNKYIAHLATKKKMATTCVTIRSRSSGSASVPSTRCTSTASCTGT